MNCLKMVELKKGKGGGKMNEVKIISELTGILVKNNLSALEALEALEETKKVFLERSWHIASEKQHAIKD